MQLIISLASNEFIFPHLVIYFEHSHSFFMYSSMNFGIGNQCGIVDKGTRLEIRDFEFHSIFRHKAS